MKDIPLWFYDNLENSYEDGLIEIERVYCFDFSEFTEQDWDHLLEIYQELPGGMNYLIDQCPIWFNTNEDNPPFLSASVEPPGLQVCGILSPEDWQHWHAQFIALTINLPKQQLENY